MASYYGIKIWQENSNVSEQLDSTISDFFCIKFKISIVSSLNPETTLETLNVFLTCRRDIFLSEKHGPNLVLAMFANYRYDSLEFLQTHIVPVILHRAREIDRDPVNLRCKEISLRIEVIVEVNTDDEVDQAIDDSLSTLNFKPASSSSIQALKRFKWGDESNLPLEKRLLEGLSSNKECTICLVEFLDSDEVASMPCGHVYHDGCIVKWLETSHLCPLCRYQMPS